MSNTLLMYILYAIFIIADLIAGYFHIIDSVVCTSILTGVIGHFLGIQFNQQSTPVVSEKPSDTPLNS